MKLEVHEDEVVLVPSDSGDNEIIYMIANSLQSCGIKTYKIFNDDLISLRVSKGTLGQEHVKKFAFGLYLLTNYKNNQSLEEEEMLK